jgi:hypothetical protein
VCKADNLTAICEPIVQKMWKPRCLTTLWDFTACYRDSFTFFILRLLLMNGLASHSAECQIQPMLTVLLVEEHYGTGSLSGTVFPEHAHFNHVDLL